MRIPVFLADQHIPFETLYHPPAFTAQKRARYLRVPGRQLAKCVLLTGPAGHCLAVLPATHRVDAEAVSRELGAPYRLADALEIVHVFRDCEWGTLGPFGTLYGLPTLLDASFESDSWMVFQAHVHGTAIRMRCRDFERLERPRRFAFAGPDIRGSCNRCNRL
jgi:Ala-tRNA(Pro) deacylase